MTLKKTKPLFHTGADSEQTVSVFALTIKSLGKC